MTASFCKFSCAGNQGYHIGNMYIYANITHQARILEIEIPDRKPKAAPEDDRGRTIESVRSGLVL